MTNQIYINNYWQLLWSVAQIYVQKVGIIGAQTIYTFDETYYLANHGSLERSVNLVLQGFIHRYTHFRMHIVFSLHCNSFAYIEEKTWKLYVHPNWKHLSTLDSKPFCLGRLPPCLYTRPCMINHIWSLKQLWLQVYGHAWFHLQRLRWPVRNGEGAKNSKWKYMSPAGFEPTPCQSTTGKLQRLRPLGHEGLMVISG